MTASNPYFVRGFDVLPGSSFRSDAIEIEFTAIEAGFIGVAASFSGVAVYTDQLTAAAQGQATLLANLQRYVSTFAPMPGHLDAGGFQVRNLANGVADGDAVTVRQLTATAFAPVLPNQAGNAGKDIQTDGANAFWSIKPRRYRALAVLNFLGY